VDDSLSVGVGDRPRDFENQPGCRAGRQWAFGQPRGQCVARHELHREIRLTIDLTHLVDGDHLGMIEMGAGESLGPKAGEVVGSCERPAADHLQGDNPPQGAMPGAVNHPHSPRSQLVEQVVITESALSFSRDSPNRLCFSAVSGRGDHRQICGDLSRRGGQKVGEFGHMPQLTQFLGEMGVLACDLVEVRHFPLTGLRGQLGDQSRQLFIVIHETWARGTS